MEWPNWNGPTLWIGPTLWKGRRIWIADAIRGADVMDGRRIWMADVMDGRRMDGRRYTHMEGRRYGWPTHMGRPNLVEPTRWISWTHMERPAGVGGYGCIIL